MRFFNTEGPVNCADHYCLPPLSRLDMADVMMLIAQKKYFLLHAPRQAGKTTCLLALADALNRAGRYRAVYANIEVAQAYRENVDKGMAAVVEQIARDARDQIGERKRISSSSTAAQGARGRRSSGYGSSSTTGWRSRCGGCERGGVNLSPSSGPSMWLMIQEAPDAL
jgi:hypothetical protein